MDSFIGLFPEPPGVNEIDEEDCVMPIAPGDTAALAQLVAGDAAFAQMSDLILAEVTGGKYHVAHLSTRRAVERMVNLKS